MRRDGFTLIELMIVVAIIAIILAIAIPSLQQSRKAATETAIIGTLKAIVSANEQYRMRYGVYANPIDNLGIEYVPQIMPPNSTLEKYDENYQSNGVTWTMPVWPKVPGVTGDRSFYVDTSGVIRVELSGMASSLSPPLD